MLTPIRNVLRLRAVNGCAKEFLLGISLLRWHWDLLWVVCQFCV